MLDEQKSSLKIISLLSLDGNLAAASEEFLDEEKNCVLETTKLSVIGAAADNDG